MSQKDSTWLSRCRDGPRLVKSGHLPAGVMCGVRVCVRVCVRVRVRVCGAGSRIVLVLASARCHMCKFNPSPTYKYADVY